MSFNGIEGKTNEPGEIPWEIVVAYFAVALAVAFILGKRNGGLRKFSTMDFVYIGIGAALSVVWGFYIGAFIQRAIPSVVGNFIGVGPLGKLFVAFIIAALVRKVGAGMLLYAVFDILGDLFFYGFGGEPMFLLYEALTYGLFLDLAIAATGGNLFGVKWWSKVNSPTRGADGSGAQTEAVKKPMLSPRTLAIIEGAILGCIWAIPSPLFSSAFFNPLVYGTIVNWTKITFNIYAFMPADIIGGIVAALAALRISKAI